MKPRLCFSLSCVIHSSTIVTSTIDGFSLLEVPMATLAYAGPVVSKTLVSYVTTSRRPCLTEPHIHL